MEELLYKFSYLNITVTMSNITFLTFCERLEVKIANLSKVIGRRVTRYNNNYFAIYM